MLTRERSMEIRTLSDLPMESLHRAREEAFRDYPRSWDRPAFERMLQRRGYTPALSLGAFDGGRMAAFVLNGTGSYKGVRAAYDTGTGTIPGYRGRGLTSRLLDMV